MVLRQRSSSGRCCFVRRRLGLCSGPRPAPPGCPAACRCRTNGDRSAWTMPALSTRNWIWPAFGVARRRHVRGAVPTLRVRHRAARAEDLAQRADDAHRRARRRSPRRRACRRPDAGRQVIHADDVGAGGLGLFWRALGRTPPPAGLAGAGASRRRHAPPGRTSWRRCRAARPRRWTHRNLAVDPS